MIIPVRDGGEAFRLCLEALSRSSRKPDEIIVVDDSSADTSRETALHFGALVLDQAGGPFGPAAARNRGAQAAASDLLVFVDADIAVHADSLAKLEDYANKNPEIAAFFGSYDDAPSSQSTVSLYKNLEHHYVHQHSRQEAGTFWAGIGAIRKEPFLRVGGFDEGYNRPSIEDIQLGIRLKQAGYRIWLCADVQGKHLKRWSFMSMLRSDIADRAVPWTRLILSSAKIPSDLNLNLASRLSALLAWIFVISLFAGLEKSLLWTVSALSIVLLILLNINLYRLFHQRGSWIFVIGAFGLHLFYFLYSSFLFGLLTLEYLVRNGLSLQNDGRHRVSVKRGTSDDRG